MSAFDEIDTDKNGSIDRAEWDAMMLDAEKKRLDDLDHDRDQRRLMAFLALWGLFLYPVLVMASSYLGADKAAEILGSMATIYFPSVSLLLGAYMGFSSMSDKGANKS